MNPFLSTCIYIILNSDFFTPKTSQLFLNVLEIQMWVTSRPRQKHSRQRLATGLRAYGSKTHVLSVNVYTIYVAIHLSNYNYVRYDVNA